MKVAVVYDFIPHYRGAVMKCLDRRGAHEYAFFASAVTVRPGIRAMDVSALRDFRHTPGRYLAGRFLVQRRLMGLALGREFGAIIFLANPYFLTTWLAAALARLSGKRVLFWTHGWLREESGLKGLTRHVFYKLAHALLLYGDRAKAIGEAGGFRSENLYPIYNSLDFDAQMDARKGVAGDDASELRQKWFGDAATPVVVCSARLIPACRFDLLVEALARLGESGHTVNLLLIGDGPERAALATQAASRNVKITFAGECYDEMTLCRWLSAADVTVSPGKVGLTAMQSLAFGVPVVTHDDFGSQMPEAEVIRPGVNGDLFRKDDIDDLARVIRKWTPSPLPRDAVARACIDSLIPKYTPQGQVVEIERAIDGAAPSLAWRHETHFIN